MSRANQQITEFTAHFLGRHGIKQKDLAEVLGVSESTMSMKLSGSRSWSVDQTRQLLSYFQEFDTSVSFEDLFRTEAA